MKRIFQFLAVALVTVMLSGTAWAVTAGHNLGLSGVANPTGLVDDGATNYIDNDMVSVAPDGRGDLLIYPMVYATADFATKLTIVNTNENASQIAKVVLRDFDESVEVLNFYIYLSPADAWTGYLYLHAGTNEFRLYSDDDSIKTVFDQWATPADPFDGRLRLGGNPVAGPMWFGYATVFNVATTASAAAQGLPAATQAALNNRPGNKPAIENWFWNTLTPAQLTADAPLAGALGSNIVRPGPNLQQLFPVAVTQDAALPRLATAQRNFDRNNLAGWQSFSFGNATPPFEGTANASAAIQATTLRNYFVSDRPGLGRDMTMAVDPNTGRVASQWNNLNEVEAVLAKSRTMMPFMNTDSQQSIHVFNFPTKYTGLGPLNAAGTARFPASNVFQANGFGALNENMYFSLRAFDLQEQLRTITTSPSSYDWGFETEMIDTGWLDGPNQFDGRLWDEGWIEYIPLNNADLPVFTGPLATANVTEFGNAPRVGDLLNIWGLPMLAMHIHLDGAGFSASSAAYGPTFSIVTGQGGAGVDPFTDSYDEYGRPSANSMTDGRYMNSTGTR